MPRRSVKSVYEMAMEVLTEFIWEFSSDHRSSCKNCILPYQVDSCSAMKSVKKRFTLPQNLAQEVFKKIQLLLNPDPQLNLTEFRKDYKNNYLLHIFAWLLYVPELKIRHLCMSKLEDAFLIVRFGQSVQSLSFYKCKVLFENQDLLKTLLFCVSNIRALHLVKVILTDNLLQLVGQECLQLKVLDNLELDENVSPQLFEKLCFRIENGERIRNRCCDTLQVVSISKFRFDETSDLSKGYILQDKMNEYAPLLLENLPNLKSLGHCFELDKYLDSISWTVIPETGLEDVYLSLMTPLLPFVCPKLKKLFIAVSRPDDFIDLQACESLENLTLRNIVHSRPVDFDFLYREVLSFEWGLLKVFNCSYSVRTLNVSILAKCMPNLETLFYRYFETANWDGMTQFKYLRRAYFITEKVHDISWVRSFSQPVQELCLYVSCLQESSAGTSFSRNTCSVLVTEEFSNLEELSFECFLFDYAFVTSVILNCPLLKKFGIYLEEEEKTQMDQFLDENNFDIMFHEE